MKTVAQKQIAWWLFCGVVLIYFQIILGGITRLTGSGLSITKWEIITGAIPPLNEDSWNIEFEKYRQTPQYHKLNKGMSLAEFKQIYFWEYLHRLWARMMGFVFAIPFVIFLIQKKLSSALIKKLIVLIVLASLVASYGWIMVKSGLVDRPWVDAYKLTLHLSLALVTYGYLLWLWMENFFTEKHFFRNQSLKKFSTILLIVLSFQLVLGGLMSGMKAGLFYPTFPDMNGRFIPAVLLEKENWTFSAFSNYSSDLFSASLVHFTHRMTAYLFLILAILFYWKIRKNPIPKNISSASHTFLFITLLQVLLGILTVVNFSGEIPVTLGVLHQAVAILLLKNLLLLFFLFRRKIT